MQARVSHTALDSVVERIADQAESLDMAAASLQEPRPNCNTRCSRGRSKKPSKKKRCVASTAMPGVRSAQHTRYRFGACYLAACLVSRLPVVQPPFATTYIFHHWRGPIVGSYRIAYCLDRLQPLSEL